MTQQKNLFRVPAIKTAIRRIDNGITINIDLVDEDAEHFYYREGPKGNESIGHWPKSQWERFSDWEARRLREYELSIGA